METYSILFWVIGGILGWVLLYYVIKSAVVNGIRESGLLESEQKRHVEQQIFESSPNSAQMLLKQKYEKGEISLEEYQSEWNRLKG
ncbi:MAG: hypothetical protein V4557_14785 [Bacteroidota bacterium]